MRRMRISGSILLAALVACCAFAAASASAELPELGRCVRVEGVAGGKNGKKMTYSGAYKNKTCLAPSPTKKGKYEFLPGPGAANHFYGVGEDPEPVLETTGGKKVECTEEIVEGEYTGPKTEKAKVTLGGCSTGREPRRECQTNPAKEGLVEGSGTFEGELGVIAGGAKPTVGWDLKREGGGTAFTFECGIPPQGLTLETIEGSVIGTLAKGFFGTDINKMSIYAALNYRQSKGLQQPEMFEGQAKDVLSTTLVEGLAAPVTEQTGLETTLETTSGLGQPIEEPVNQEPLEVKTITR